MGGRELFLCEKKAALECCKFLENEFESSRVCSPSSFFLSLFAISHFLFLSRTRARPLSSLWGIEKGESASSGAPSLDLALSLAP